MEDLCNTSGGWTRIAYLNMSDPHEQCPSGFKLYNQNGVRGCGRAALRKTIANHSSSPLTSNTLKFVENIPVLVTKWS